MWRMGSVVCGMRALSLRSASSVVVARGLSCLTACGILVPQPGIEPASPALEGGFFTTAPPGKSLERDLNLDQEMWVLRNKKPGIEAPDTEKSLLFRSTSLSIISWFGKQTWSVDKLWFNHKGALRESLCPTHSPYYRDYLLFSLSESIFTSS